MGRYLLGLAKRQGKRLADGFVLVTRPPQQEIAHYIGSSRETVSRALNDLEKQGLIRLAGRKILLYRFRGSAAPYTLVEPRLASAGSSSLSLSRPLSVPQLPGSSKGVPEIFAGGALAEVGARLPRAG